MQTYMLAGLQLREEKDGHMLMGCHLKSRRETSLLLKTNFLTVLSVDWNWLHIWRYKLSKLSSPLSLTKYYGTLGEMATGRFIYLTIPKLLLTAWWILRWNKISLDSSQEKEPIYFGTKGTILLHNRHWVAIEVLPSPHLSKPLKLDIENICENSGENFSCMISKKGKDIFFLDLLHLCFEEIIQ